MSRKSPHPRLVPIGDHVARLRRSQVGDDGGTLSQEELAERSGLHRTQVGAIEQGRANFGMLTLLKLARGLGVKPRDVLPDG